MKIILKNIPAETTPQQIKKFILMGIRRKFTTLFGPSIKLLDVKIYAEKDRNFNIVSYHSIAVIEPDKAAKIAVLRLRKIPFNSQRIEIREFIHRTWQNDRRHKIQTNLRHINSRRRADRRQNRLEVVTHFGVKFSGIRDFSRKLAY